MSEPPTNLRIRAATAFDRGAAIRLLSEHLAERGLTVEEDGVARAVELNFAQHAASWLVLATTSGLPAGVLLANPLVSVERGGGALTIEALYVTPAQRRRGIGRALLEHVVREAHGYGLGSVEAQLLPAEAGARALCEALGFKATERALLERRL